MSLIMSNILNYKRGREDFFWSCVPFHAALTSQPSVHFLSCYKELADMINVKFKRVESQYRYGIFILFWH